MTAAIALSVVCVLLTAAVVALIASRNPDRRKSRRPLGPDFRIWSVEAPREVPHE